MVPTKAEAGAAPSDLKVGGRLSLYANAWRHDSWSYKIVSRGLSWAWLPGRPPKRVAKGQPSTPLIEDYVVDMLRKGSIEPVPSEPIIRSHLFSVPKKDSMERRMVLDLSRLNRFIPCPGFKMTTVKAVRQVLDQGSWIVTLDLKDAYWHVPIRESFRNFLAFQVESRAYRFRAMPFGLNIAPRIFTKLVTVLIKELRAKGVKIFAYLDDWLIWESSPHRCRAALQKVLRVIEKYGFLVNEKKSMLTPAQRVKWLGLIWDTNEGSLSLPQDYQAKVKAAVKDFVAKKFVTRRQLERVVGLINFACTVDPLGRVYLKRVNRHMRRAANAKMRDRQVRLSVPLKHSLRRWLKSDVLSRGIPWIIPQPSLELYTDASQSGWGFHASNGLQKQGVWSNPLRGCHINIKEMVVIWIALRSLRLKRGTSIRVHSDNSVVVCCLNRGGLSQINTPLVLDPFNCSIVRNQGLVSNSGARERDQQRPRGRSIQGSSDCDGVGVRYRQLPVDSESRCETPGGSVCHQGEPQAAPICISHSRQEGDRDRRPQDRLELLEDTLPFSTGKDDAPGPSQLEFVVGLVVLVAPY